MTSEEIKRRKTNIEDGKSLGFCEPVKTSKKRKRLGEALKENLKKRKNQTRSRKAIITTMDDSDLAEE